MVTRFAVSDKLANKLNGKLRSLKVLESNPKSESAELKPFVTYLSRTINQLIRFNELPATQENLRIVARKLSEITKLEDLVIRVILAGETIEGVTKRNQERIANNKM